MIQKQECNFALVEIGEDEKTGYCHKKRSVS